MSTPAAPYRRALVTGASRGIGRALSVALAARGVHVVAAARSVAALEDVVRAIREAGGSAEVLSLDVTELEETVARVRRVDDEGALDLVVANAGVGPASDAPALSWESWRAPLHTNFTGAAATLTAVLPRMVERRRGHLVGVSSLASLGPLPDAVPYCAPKAGLNMLLECLRLDLRGTGVAVTTVRPGFVRTDMVAKTSFWMPQLLEPETAAAIMAERLPAAPAVIDFPRALAFAARWGARLPQPLRDQLLRVGGGR